LVFAYAPDPGASFDYAAGAAKLAIVLTQLGETAVADLFRKSALHAWDWADQALANPDEVFGEARDLLGLPSGEFEARLAPILQRERNQRIWAAATLFRLTGEERFNAVALERLKSPFGESLMDAAWEYANTNQSETDATVQGTILRSIVAFAEENIVRPQQMHISYRNMKHFYAPIGWGTGAAPTHAVIAALIRAHHITRANKFIAAMEDGSAHILGANQIGMSFTVGLGYRWPLAPLHEDSIAAGVPAPNGITIYGWAPPALMAGQYWYVWGPKWAALSDMVPTRRVEPIRTSLPLYEFLIDYPRIIISAEYTVQQTIATTAAMWIYLNGYRDQ
jgi:endoglucanase